MSNIIIINLISLFFSFISYSSQNQNKTRFVFKIFRHGARAPFTDKNGIDALLNYWKEGNYKITTLGIHQEYVMGLHDRIKYSKYLDEKFSPKEIKAMSSNADRTIISANAYLMGLYNKQFKEEFTSTQRLNSIPPIFDNIDIQSIDKEYENYFSPNNIQLIPVHILKEANRLNFFKENCPFAEKVFQKNLNLSEIVNFYTKFNKTYAEELCKLLKIPYPESKTHFMNHKEVFWFSDSINNAYIHDKEIEILKKSSINMTQLLKDAHESIYLDNFYYFAGDKQMSMVYSTSLMQEIIKLMKARVEIDEENGLKQTYDAKNTKFVIYALHDYDLTSVFVSLSTIFNLNITFFPTFSSSITLELVYCGDDENVINKDDFYIKFDFNGREIFNFSFNYFYEEIDKNIYNEKEFKLYCHQENKSDKIIKEYFDKNKNVKINYQGILAGILFLICVIEFIIIYKYYYNSENNKKNNLNIDENNSIELNE